MKAYIELHKNPQNNSIRSEHPLSTPQTTRIEDGEAMNHAFALYTPPRSHDFDNTLRLQLSSRKVSGVKIGSKQVQVQIQIQIQKGSTFSFYLSCFPTLLSQPFHVFDFPYLLSFLLTCLPSIESFLPKSTTYPQLRTAATSVKKHLLSRYCLCLFNSRYSHTSESKPKGKINYSNQKIKGSFIARYQ